MLYFSAIERDGNIHRPTVSPSGAELPTRDLKKPQGNTHLKCLPHLQQDVTNLPRHWREYARQCLNLDLSNVCFLVEAIRKFGEKPFQKSLEAISKVT